MIAALALAAGLATSAPVDDDTSVSLVEVLDAVERTHPRLDAARASAERAGAAAFAARGPFDPRLRVRGAFQPIGYYRWNVVETELRARTIAFGLTPFVGWRLGLGEFPIYDGRQQTARAGEVRAGVELPLLRDGMIDGPRAARRKADRSRSIAGREAEQRRLELLRDAAVAYWEWVAAGERVAVRERLYELARERGRGMDRQLRDGNVAEFEALDNQRLILAREAGLVAARRDVRRAAIDLSLFLRDAEGAPREPAGAIPALAMPPPLIEDVDLQAEIAGALERRPDVAIAEAVLANARVDTELARNAVLPSLTAQAYVAKDLGNGPAALRPAEVAVGVAFEIPLGLRGARGELRSARAELRRLQHELEFVRDRVGVEVRAAHVEMRAARRRAELAGEQAALAETLATAERARLGLGESTILVVNLREEAAADAAVARVDAIAEYRKSRARYQAATGVLPHR